ncbi:MAG: hypothetical protein ACRELZ_13620 [Candidatus Rokuibacteriota bacterium]
MSVLVSGPRRVFVMLVVWERLTDAYLGCPRPLARLQQAVGASVASPRARWSASGWRQTVWIRLQRVLCGRLVGLHLFVLAPDGERPRA